MENEITAKHLELHRNILRELGYTLTPGARILDFGCGAGRMVSAYRRIGYESYGCDLTMTEKSDLIRPIPKDSYSIPFPDNWFDFVYSDQVLEHVQDHDLVFAEIYRVLKAGGVSLHSFPSRLKPTESHLLVPLGGLIQNRFWLTLWALLGIRNSFQAGKGFREVVDLNDNYLKDRTNYLSKAEISKAVSAYFPNPTFAEEYMIKHSYGKARHIYPLVKRVPFVASLYSSFYGRVILFQKPPSISQSSEYFED